MKPEKSPAVYMMSHKKRGVIYIGVTSALWDRVSTHKAETVPGFTAHYHANILVWYEHHHTMELAIKREKQLKNWKRDWKIRLIEAMNLDWRDLYDEIDIVATLVPLAPSSS